MLDTHTFLWWVDDSPRLSAKARRAIRQSNSVCTLSVASCWEMAIKVSLGRLRIGQSVDRFLSEQMAANGVQPLNVLLTHLGRLSSLPFHHRDPVDRLLVAQALEEDLTVVSSDSSFDAYGVTRIW